MKYEKVFDTETKSLISIESFTKDNIKLWAHRHSSCRFLSESQQEILSFVDKINERHYKKSGTVGEVRAHFKKNPCNINRRDELIAKIAKYEYSIHNFVSKMIRDGEVKNISVVTPTIESFGKTREIYSVCNVEILDIISEDKAIFENSKYRPDLYVLANINNVIQTLAIEIKYSHEIGDEKLKYYKEHNINCIEIDISSIKSEIRIDNKTEKVTKSLAKELKELVILNKYDNNYFLNSVWLNVLQEHFNSKCKKITYSPYAMGDGYLCDSKRFQRVSADRPYYNPEKSIMAVLYHKDNADSDKHFHNFIEVDWQNMHGIYSVDYDRLHYDKCTNTLGQSVENPFYEHLIYAEINKVDMTKSVYYINTTDKCNSLLRNLDKESVFEFLNTLTRHNISQMFRIYNKFDNIIYIQ